jgi:hypothetical protein
MNTIERLKSTVRIFLTALTMTLALTGCPSDSGYSDDSGGDDGNGCQAGYCRSNGACCPTSHAYYCHVSDVCFATNGEMMADGCASVTSEGC